MKRNIGPRSLNATVIWKETEELSAMVILQLIFNVRRYLAKNGERRSAFKINCWMTMMPLKLL